MPSFLAAAVSSQAHLVFLSWSRLGQHGVSRTHQPCHRVDVSGDCWWPTRAGPLRQNLLLPMIVTPPHHNNSYYYNNYYRRNPSHTIKSSSWRKSLFYITVTCCSKLYVTHCIKWSPPTPYGDCEVTLQIKFKNGQNNWSLRLYLIVKHTRQKSRNQVWTMQISAQVSKLWILPFLDLNSSK